MKTQQFLEHHGIRTNPFAEEDAQTDPVFKDYCISSTHHPTWDKIYGDPAEPATSIVFGEKGSGKTAMRLQIVRHLEDYNRAHPSERVFVIEYDDFNPFLDRFRDRFGARRRRPVLLGKIGDDCIGDVGVIFAGGDAGGVAQAAAGKIASLGMPAGEEGRERGGQRLRQVADARGNLVMLLRRERPNETAERLPKIMHQLQRRLVGVVARGA